MNGGAVKIPYISPGELKDAVLSLDYSRAKQKGVNSEEIPFIITKKGIYRFYFTESGIVIKSEDKKSAKERGERVREREEAKHDLISDLTDPGILTLYEGYIIMKRLAEKLSNVRNGSTDNEYLFFNKTETAAVILASVLELLLLGEIVMGIMFHSYKKNIESVKTSYQPGYKNSRVQDILAYGLDDLKWDYEKTDSGKIVSATGRLLYMLDNEQVEFRYILTENGNRLYSFSSDGKARSDEAGNYILRTLLDDHENGTHTNEVRSVEALEALIDVAEIFSAAKDQ